MRARVCVNMEKYKLVERKSVHNSNGMLPSGPDGSTDDSSSSASHELRITQQGKPRNYITYAMKLLNGTADTSTGVVGTASKGVDSKAPSGQSDGSLMKDGTKTVVLKAMGRAVNKAVTIAEILKRKAPLHQITALSSCELIDVYEPLEEGLDRVQTKRFVSCMIITLSLNPLDTTNIGYQPPLPLSEMRPGDANPDTSLVSCPA